jgi:hypothetical protein
MPNAIDLLKADHTHVKDLFRQYEAAGHRAHQRVITQPGSNKEPIGASAFWMA